MLQLRPRDSLSGGDFGWLKARHHFKVTPRGNPAHEPLCALVVWNDDEIAPGGGFDLHGHKNMEIISYVREGAVNPSGHAREPRTDGSRRRPGHERRDRHPPRRAQRRRSPAEAVPDSGCCRARAAAGRTGARANFPRPIAPARWPSWPVAIQATLTPCRSGPTPGCSARP